MGLIGLLHRNVSHGTTQTEIYFVSEGTQDRLQPLQLYHKHSYFHSQAKKVLVPNCRFERGSCLMHDSTVSEVLYTGKRPFVIAEVSHTELGYIFDSNRHSNQDFIDDVLTRHTIIQKLTSKTNEDELLDDAQRGRIIRTMIEKGTYMGKPLQSYKDVKAIQIAVQKKVHSFEQTLMERLAQQGLSGQELDKQFNHFKGCGFEIMKEIDVIDLLLDLKDAKGRNIEDFNDREYPEKLLNIIGMRH